MNFYTSPVWSDAQNLNMNLLEMKYCELDADWHSENACAPFDRIYFITGGEGVAVQNGKVTLLTPGNAYVIPAGLNYSYCCHSHLEKYFFHVNLPRQDNYDLLSPISEILVLFNQQEAIAGLRKHWNCTGRFSALFIRTLLCQTVCLSLETVSDTLGNIQVLSATVQKAIDLIDSAPDMRLGIHEIAAECFSSESSLQKKFRKEVGVSIGKYLHDRVMFAAEREVRTTAKPLSVISEQFGFCDQFYFSRMFSSHYGVSPLKYRKFILSERG